MIWIALKLVDGLLADFSVIQNVIFAPGSAALKSARAWCERLLLIQKCALAAPVSGSIMIANRSLSLNCFRLFTATHFAKKNARSTEAPLLVMVFPSLFSSHICSGNSDLLFAVPTFLLGCMQRKMW